MEKTKVCSECGQEKPLSEFNKRRSSKDGHQDRCRECFSRYNKARYHADPVRFKEGIRKYRDENLENLLETRMNMCEKNPSHKNANMAVDYAVKLGYLNKPDYCMGCGRPTNESRVTAHHHDYTKPLEVVWVCSKCHRQLDANKRERDGLSRFGNSKKVILVCEEKDICSFDSIEDAAKAVGRSRSGISQCLSGKSKTCAGFSWRYGEME